MSHPVVHYPLLLFTTSRNYDVVDLARQSNPNFFIVTPAPSRGRKLGKPAKQKIEWGKIKQIKVVLKLVVMVKADDFYGHCGSNLTQSRSFFSRLLLRPFGGRWWPTLFFFDQREPRCRRQRGFEFPEGFFSALFANKTTLKKKGEVIYFLKLFSSSEELFRTLELFLYNKLLHKK